jgi:hypothetical protein
MKKLTSIFVFVFCFTILSSLAFTQTFPAEWVKGPFPTGTEVVRGDAPCDETLPDEMGTIHEYTAYRGTPVVDGDVDDDPVWNQIPWTAFNKYTVAGGESCFIFDGACEATDNYWGPDDISAWLKILWDDDNIYFALKKIDNEYVYNEANMGDSQGNIWQDDAYQIIINANDPFDQTGPLPGAEVGVALLDFSEAAYQNTWDNKNDALLELAEGGSESAVLSGDGKMFFGSHGDHETGGYIEVLEFAFVKWDEIEADTPSMFSIMANDPDDDHTVDALEWSQGIFNGKLQERYASIVYSSSEAPSDAVAANQPAQPTEFALAQNYPNPFNPTTTISYAINTRGNVELNVYDLLGHKVASLVNEVKNAGVYNVTFDAEELSSGVYIYTLKSAESVMSNKMILMK